MSKKKKEKNLKRIFIGQTPIQDRLILGYTPKQRQWILERDSEEFPVVDNEGKVIPDQFEKKPCCQFLLDESEGMKFPRRCCSTYRLECHHITAKGYAHFKLHWREKKINGPDNGIILCRHHHLGRVHAEMELVGNFMYRFSEDAYEILIKWHRALTAAGHKYWWTYWDDDLRRRARARTWDFTHNDKNEKINPFPYRKNKEALRK